MEQHDGDDWPAAPSVRPYGEEVDSSVDSHFNVAFLHNPEDPFICPSYTDCGYVDYEGGSGVYRQVYSDNTGLNVDVYGNSPFSEPTDHSMSSTSVKSEQREQLEGFESQSTFPLLPMPLPLRSLDFHSDHRYRCCTPESGSYVHTTNSYPACGRSSCSATPSLSYASDYQSSTVTSPSVEPDDYPLDGNAFFLDNHDKRKRTFATDEAASFKCDLCSKLFQRQYNLRAHMLTHNPDRPRPYKCDHPKCSNSFVRQADLRRHKESASRTPVNVGHTLTDTRCTMVAGLSRARAAAFSFRERIRPAGQSTARVTEWPEVLTCSQALRDLRHLAPWEGRAQASPRVSFWVGLKA